jgi:hypothetical protein
MGVTIARLHDVIILQTYLFASLKKRLTLLVASQQREDRKQPAKHRLAAKPFSKKNILTKYNNILLLVCAQRLQNGCPDEKGAVQYF